MSPSTPVLRASALSRAYGDRRVLTDLSFAVDPGHRLGLVGENGIGKSTLLRLLAGVEEPDTGEVHRPADLAYLAQEPPFGPLATLGDVIGGALSEVRAVAAELEAAATALTEDTAEAATRYDLALARAEAAEVWDADARAQRVLAGLGLGEVDPGRTSGSLSGGQRSRLALAAVLIRRPRAVLLDEPTNHLDDDAADFLAGALAELPGAVVLASHDRVFLDEVVTEILDLDPGVEGPRVIGGSYTDFREAKRIAREQWQQRWLAEREELSALRAAIAPDGKARQVVHGRPMRDNNKMAYGRHGDFVQQQVGRRVRNTQRRLTELEREQVRKPPRELRFTSALTGTTRREGTLISVRDAVVPGRVEVGALDVHADTALLVTGPNGSGKSTLLHLLAGDLAPASGTAWRAKGVTVALLEQDVGLAEDDRSPLAVYELVSERLADPVPLQDLGLVAPRDLNRPLRELSVGQRRRVVLALLVAQTPDVLLLDEPTNHISLALADELGDALRTAPGAVVVASHDRWLRRRWHGEQLEVVDGRLVPTLNA
ncbi:ABC transporter ATP-binding protein [Cellulomonas denverensis]|uniref:ABC-F family ATP-binding cassette domain-containing protein n=1 Tax=Cellulomonas denverensis TaxID=264297 RepID=A0A7X6R050_9CELL|nr:ABC-F family ATP-binding cassette domain-containing protein [Cellulomonas denverensis]NKY23934.1 ABC-F family ATP-binding cassette domain-containing protein [Cellulomonas denverensis]GIG24946.1 ABC transporter ATP-binding protein [Cellulomonas denverensis]